MAALARRNVAWLWVLGWEAERQLLSDHVAKAVLSSTPFSTCRGPSRRPFLEHNDFVV